MYLLDTNVVSELRKAKGGNADRNVVAWAGSVPPARLFVSAITILELELGVLLIERRDAAQGTVLRRWLERRVLPAFSGRILPVDTPVARRCATLHVPDRRSDRDALIAATALVHGMTVATRNTADFEPTGAAVLDPWRKLSGRKRRAPQ
jgi:predicted nucleic acid-binding protein